jgi:endo-1,4-beta-xylanase
MMAKRRLILITLLMTTVLAAKADAPATLKDAYKQAFFVGAAVNAAQFTEKDARGAALVETQFNSITLSTFPTSTWRLAKRITCSS